MFFKAHSHMQSVDAPPYWGIHSIKAVLIHCSTLFWFDLILKQDLAHDGGLLI